ncbi:MAG: type IV secretion system DNA-binding domain-containing protein [Candidatus Paceibacterota bacterium]
MDKKPVEKQDPWLYIVGFLVFFFIFFPIPSMLFLLFRYIFKGRIKRTEGLALCVVSGTYLLFYPSWFFEYFTWVSYVLRGSDKWWHLPVLPILAMSLLLTGFSFLFSGTKLAAWVPARIGKYNPLRKSEVQTGILPTVEEKKLAAKGVAELPRQLVKEGISSVDQKLSDEGRFVIGAGKLGEPITITEKEVRTHALLFGSTGSGKTESIKAIAGGLLDLGWHGIILDLKEDAQTGGLLDWCNMYADAHAIGFQQFRISDPSPKYWFSPLLGMGPDEARDTILASQQFEAAYYRALNEKQLGQLIQLLYACNSIDPVAYPTPTVYEIGKVLAAPSLPQATRERVAIVTSTISGYKKEDFDSLINPDAAMVQAAGGLGARLTAMYETQAGRRALRGGDGRIEFDVTKPGLSYVGLDSLGKPELTKLVSTSVLQRMAVYAADRTSGKISDTKPRFLIVDEANFVARKVLLNLLSRARSAGIACIVCTQGPTDWSAREPGEPDLTSLVQNSNIALIMRQGERTNAELCADIIGRAEKSILTQQVRNGEVTLAGSMSTTVDYLVSPDYLRSLETGEAILRVGSPQERQQFVKVARRDPNIIYRS